jgi:hypothetical protein
MLPGFWVPTGAEVRAVGFEGGDGVAQDLEVGLSDGVARGGKGGDKVGKAGKAA